MIKKPFIQFCVLILLSACQSNKQVDTPQNNSLLKQYAVPFLKNSTTSLDSVNRLRRMLASITDVAGTNDINIETTDSACRSYPVDALLKKFDADSAGAICGFDAFFLSKIYDEFDFKSFTYNHGVSDKGKTHVLTVVQVKINGHDKYLIQDALFNGTYTDSLGSPKDFFELLHELKQRQTANIVWKQDVDTADFLFGKEQVKEILQTHPEIKDRLVKVNNSAIPYKMRMPKGIETMWFKNSSVGKEYLDALESVNLPRQLPYLLLLQQGELGSMNMNEKEMKALQLKLDSILTATRK